MAKLPSLPENALLKDLWSLYPKNAPLVMGLVNSLLRGDGELSIANRELIAAYVSGLNSCTFCFDSHRKHAEAFGIDEGLFDSLMEDIGSVPLEPGIAELLDCIKDLNTLPSKLDQNKMQAILIQGISEKAIFEAIQIAALFNMMNRIVEGAGVSFDFEAEGNESTHPSVVLGEKARNHTYI